MGCLMEYSGQHPEASLSLCYRVNRMRGTEMFSSCRNVYVSRWRSKIKTPTVLVQSHWLLGSNLCRQARPAWLPDAQSCEWATKKLLLNPKIVFISHTNIVTNYFIYIKYIYLSRKPHEHEDEYLL